MKKFILLLMALMPIMCLAQIEFPKLYLQEDGTFLSEDGKDYVVVNMPGKTKAELYNMVRININNLWNSAKDVESDVKNEQISVMGWIPQIATTPHNIIIRTIASWYKAQVRFQWEFKDGRIKVCAPIIKTVRYDNGDGSASYYGRSLKTWVKQTDAFKKGHPNPKDGDKNYQRIMDAINNHAFCFKDKEQEDW